MNVSRSRLRAAYRHDAEKPVHREDAHEVKGNPPSEDFVRLLTGHYHTLYGFVLALVGNAHAADDLMQECCLILWRKSHEFDLDSADRDKDFLVWARTTARNLVRNFHRLRQPPSLAFTDQTLSQIASTRLASEELLELRKQALQSCVGKLVSAERRLLRACYAKDSTIDSAATSLKRTPNSVYKALRRIRRRLFECINRTLGLDNS